MSDGVRTAKAALLSVVLGVCDGAAAFAKSSGPGKAAPLSEEYVDSIKGMMGAPKGAIVVRGEDIYWTTLDGSLMREPRAGGQATKVIATLANDLQADDRGLYNAEPDGLYLLPLGAGGQPPIRISPLAKAQLMASDADNLYCVVPNYSFDPTRNSGVYRVDKRRGEAVLLWRPTAPHDEPELALAGPDLYVASSANGVIFRLDKETGKSTPIVRGQPRIDSIAVDATYLYWHVGRTGDVRRTLRKGGRKVDVVARKVDDEHVFASPSGAYWFAGGPGRTGYRLMWLSPGAAGAVPVARDLNMPAGLTVDDRSVYVGDVVGRRIVRLPRPSPPPVGCKTSRRCIPPGDDDERAAF
jgi:sugar lactone lactonase YvrE